MASFRNLLAPLAGFTVALTSPTPGVQVLAGGPIALGPLGTLDTVALPAGQFFRVVMPMTSAPNSAVALRFGFTDAAGGYRDFEYVTLTLGPEYVTLDSTQLGVTVTSRGDLGYDHADPRYGSSVALLPRGSNLLTEGGLLVGVAPDRVSDRLRSATAGQPDDDFRSVQPIAFTTPLPWAVQTATGIFADSAGPAQAGVRVAQRAWNSSYPGCERAVVVEYSLINQTTDTLRTPYAGLFADWDIQQFDHNTARWDSTRRLGYVAPALSGADTVFAGLKLLTSQPAATYAFDQLAPAAPGPVNATDGLTAAEKWAALVAASGAPTAAGTTSGGSDVAHVVRASLPALAPQDTALVAWAVLAAPSLAALQAAADSIQALFDATQLPAPQPVAVGASRCGPGTLTLTAAGAAPGGTYRWYAADFGGTVLTTGPTFTTPVLAASDTFFVSSVTRVGRESGRVPVLAVIDTVPAAPVLMATTQMTGTVLLTTAGGQPAQFYLNGGALPGGPVDSLLLTTAAQNGLYTVTVVSPAGCVSLPSNAVPVFITGRRKDALASAVGLFPNPTTADVRLTLPAPARVTVTDALGRVVLEEAAPAGESWLILATQPAGVYAVRVLMPAGTVVKRVVRE